MRLTNWCTKLWVAVGDHKELKIFQMVDVDLAKFIAELIAVAA